MKHKIVPRIKIGMGLWLIFTLTTPVFIGGASPSLAQDPAGMESSYPSQAEEGGVLDSALSFFKSIASWIGETVGSLIATVNGVFGFERGEGSQAMFGGVFYFFLILVLLFAGKLLYNIMRDTLKSVIPKGTPDRHRKKPKEK